MKSASIIKKLQVVVFVCLFASGLGFEQVQAALPGARSGVDGGSGNVYLGGNFIEFGIGQNGSSGKAKSNLKITDFYGRQEDESGTSSAPGFLGDADGFGNGADLRIDYFLPGIAAEGWGVSLNNGVLVHALNSHSSDDITPYSFFNASAGDNLRTTGTGTWNGLKIDHAISFDVNQKYVTYQITLTNNSGSDMTQVSYMRSFDPDNTRDMSGSSATVNTVVADIATDGEVIVEALSQAGDAYNTAAGTQSLIRYYSTDSRAVPRLASGLMDTQAHTVVTGATARGTTQTADSGISIGFNIGNLANGASTNFTFYVVMRSQAGSVSTRMNTDYTFTVSDFDYVDPGVSLTKIQVKTLPAPGTLYVDDDSDGAVDGGEAVAGDDEITTVNLTKLKYKPDTDWMGSDAYTFLANSIGSTITMSVTVAGVTATFDAAAVESNLDSRSINVTLSGTTFADNSLDAANFTLNNTPAGLSVESVSYTDTTHCTVNLAYDGDFDSDVSTLGLTIASAELAVSNDLSSLSNLPVTAVNDAESITITDDGEILEGAEDGEMITVTLTGGVFSSSLTAGNWTVTNLPAGVSVAAVSRTSATVAAITLTGNASVDYDTDITNVTVECTTDEYVDSTGDAALSVNTGVAFTATVETTTTTVHKGETGSGSGSRNAAPVITEHSANPRSGSAPLAVQFACTATDSDGTVVEFLWDFQDGISTRTPRSYCTHTFTTPGVYEVELTVYDDKGSFDSAVLDIEVFDDPEDGGVPTTTTTVSGGTTTDPAGQIELTGPSVSVAGEVSTAITLSIKDSEGDTVTVTENTTFNLYSSFSDMSMFFSDAAGTSEITQVTIAKDSGTATFYYEGGESGDHTITAEWNSGGEYLAAGTHNITIALAVSDSVDAFSSFCVNVTKVEMHYADDDSDEWHETFTGSSNLDLMAGSLYGEPFPGIRGLYLADTSFDEIRITFKNSFTVSAHLLYDEVAYYSSQSVFEEQTNLACRVTDFDPGGDDTEFTFRIEDWGALNDDVVLTEFISVNIALDGMYTPTLKFTISDKLLLMGTDGTPETYHFRLMSPVVTIND